MVMDNFKLKVVEITHQDPIIWLSPVILSDSTKSINWKWLSLLIHHLASGHITFVSTQPFSFLRILKIKDFFEIICPQNLIPILMIPRDNALGNLCSHFSFIPIYLYLSDALDHYWAKAGYLNFERPDCVYYSAGWPNEGVCLAQDDQHWLLLMSFIQSDLFIGISIYFVFRSINSGDVS